MQKENTSTTSKRKTLVYLNEGADWLPFKPLVEMQGQRRKTTEVIWTKG